MRNPSPGAVCGLLAPTSFVAAWLVGGLVADDYDPLQDAISRLAAEGAPTRPLMTAGLVGLRRPGAVLGAHPRRAPRLPDPAVGGDDRGAGHARRGAAPADAGGRHAAGRACTPSPPASATSPWRPPRWWPLPCCGVAGTAAPRRRPWRWAWSRRRRCSPRSWSARTGAFGSGGFQRLGLTVVDGLARGRGRRGAARGRRPALTDLSRYRTRCTAPSTSGLPPTRDLPR
jgi:hypothetical protein